MDAPRPIVVQGKRMAYPAEMAWRDWPPGGNKRIPGRWSQCSEAGYSTHRLNLCAKRPREKGFLTWFWHGSSAFWRVNSFCMPD